MRRSHWTLAYNKDQDEERVEERETEKDGEGTGTLFCAKLKLIRRKDTTKDRGCCPHYLLDSNACVPGLSRLVSTPAAHPPSQSIREWRGPFSKRNN